MAKAKAKSTTKTAAKPKAAAKSTSQPSTKAQIITAIADAAGITKQQSKAAMDELLNIAYKGAKSPKGFTIPGLGKLIKVDRKARWGRNPATGEKIKIKARKDVKFRLAKACKDAVLGKKS